MYSFNIVLTELCNANCSHCYMNKNSRIKKRTLSMGEVDIIIDKIPKNTKTVILTGGEIFLVKELLEYSIKKIRKHNSNLIIGLESNGIYFYKNMDIAMEELKKLKNLGVSFIRFSDDPFHAVGGVDLDRVRKLKELENTQTPIIKYLVQDKAVPIGNAKKLANNYMSKSNCMNKESSLENPYLFVDILGDVYICAWKCIPSVGNILSDSWETIVENLGEKFNKLILTGRIEEAISFITNESINDLKVKSEKFGQCNLCIENLEEKKKI